MGPDNKPMSCPSLTQVLGYDFAIRTRIALLMNSGVDILTAFGQATADPEVRQTQFTSSVGVAIGTAECRALSAPGLREAYALPVSKTSGGRASAALALGDAPPAGALTRSQTQKVKKKAKKARAQAEKAANDKAAKRLQGGGGGKVHPPPRALQNGGVGDGGAKGGGKAGKKQRKVKTAGGLEICFAYNNGKPCAGLADCPRAHVCQICEGQHPMSECPNK